MIAPLYHVHNNSEFFERVDKSNCKECICIPSTSEEQTTNRNQTKSGARRWSSFEIVGEIFSCQQNLKGLQNSPIDYWVGNKLIGIST